MVNFHAFTYSIPLSPQHAIWIAFGCYFTVQTLFKQNSSQEEIKNIFQTNYNDIARDHQDKMQKAFKSFVHQKGYPDRGDGMYSQSLNVTSRTLMNELVERKLNLQKQFNLFAPAYMIGGVSFPLLALISGIFWYYYTDVKFSKLRIENQKKPALQYFFTEYNSGMTSIYIIALASSIRLIKIL